MSVGNLIKLLSFKFLNLNTFILVEQELLYILLQYESF